METMTAKMVGLVDLLEDSYKAQLAETFKTLHSKELFENGLKQLEIIESFGNMLIQMAKIQDSRHEEIMKKLEKM